MKLRRLLYYLLGAYVAFVFQKTNSYALETQLLYGVSDAPTDVPTPTPFQPFTLWEKPLTILMQPVYVAVVGALAIGIGIFLLLKRIKPKGVKKPPQS